MKTYKIYSFGQEDNPLVLKDITEVKIHLGFVEFRGSEDTIFISTQGMAFFATENAVDLMETKNL